MSDDSTGTPLEGAKADTKACVSKSDVGASVLTSAAVLTSAESSNFPHDTSPDLNSGS